jgi:hypothetical protein
MDQSMDFIESRYQELSKCFHYWEKIKDIIDQLIDLMLNYRQSGHPGGSRSKVHIFVATTLSGVMRWDIRHPEKAFGDRFILVGGHTVPLIYATLAVYNEALRIKYQQTGDPKYLIPNPEKYALYWEDLAQVQEEQGPIRPRRDGRQNPLPQVQHRTLRAWLSGCCRGSFGPEEGRSLRR